MKCTGSYKQNVRQLANHADVQDEKKTKNIWKDPEFTIKSQGKKIPLESIVLVRADTRERNRPETLGGLGLKMGE